jgi:hypothetical protein
MLVSSYTSKIFKMFVFCFSGDEDHAGDYEGDPNADDEPEEDPVPEYSEILSGAVKSGPLFFKVNIFNYRKVTAGNRNG